MSCGCTGAAGSHHVAVLQFPLKVTVEGGKTGEAAQAAALNFYHQNVKLCPPVTSAPEETVAADLFLLRWVQ